MYLRSFLLFLSIFLSIQVQAQDASLTREFSLANENDFYLLQGSDRYYSNGLIAHYRWIPQKIVTQDSTKRILDVELSHQFFTPDNLLLSDVNDLDRPYAGMLHVGFNYNRYKERYNRRMLGVDVGLVGESTGAQAFQEWYHEAVGFPDPQGWRYQIPNEFFVNLKAQFNRQYVLSPGAVDLISSTDFSLGTAFTHAFQRLDLRVGKLQWFRNSAFSNALIGEGSQYTPRHNYLLMGFGLQYVLHNITIDGSLWSSDAPHTEASQPWVRHIRFGFVSSSDKATFKIVYNWLSPEIIGTRNHAYLALELLLRFPSN